MCTEELTLAQTLQTEITWWAALILRAKKTVLLLKTVIKILFRLNAVHVLVSFGHLGKGLGLLKAGIAVFHAELWWLSGSCSGLNCRIA